MKVFICLLVLVGPLLIFPFYAVPAVSMALCFMSALCVTGSLVLIANLQNVQPVTYRQTAARAHAARIHHI